MRPEPGSYLRTAVVLGSVTVLPFAILWSWLFATMQQRTFAEILPLGLGAGLFFGVSFGLTMAFFIQRVTAIVGVRDRRELAARLNVALSQLGYFNVIQSEDFLTYKPSFQAGMAAGRISVQFQGNQAVIVGPRMYVQKLIQRLAVD